MYACPVHSGCCALSGNYRLESNSERHGKAPLVTEMYGRYLEELMLTIPSSNTKPGYSIWLMKVVWIC
ncbi:hypothetical protein DBV23_02820 [Edwardsiella ictaluri]|nr:hypothetical protein DBV23_02820 [Edwardsiella ictaluri]WJH22635.1 hypothetical protein FGU63_05305 [Edwardsiella ictaluri]